MAIADLIPQLDDGELANLHANARRLEGGGASKQQAQAAELMPLIEAELAAREARKPPKAKRTTKRAAPTAATAAASAH